MKRLIFTLVSVLFFVLFIPSCTRAQNKTMVRPSALAGSWYPADKDSLKKAITGYLQPASAQKSNNDVSPYRTVALIEPHAGYAYSGKAAASGYNLIKGRHYKRVIILAPSHYAYFRGISLSPADYFETPLGRVPVDRNACGILLKKSGFSSDAGAHSKEHSIEIQLPFLQSVLEDFKIVPLLVGEVNGREYQTFAESIKPIIDDETLLVASSDFTHYGSRFGYVPFRENIAENLNRLDMGAEGFILKKDAEGFVKYFEDTGITVCGRKPIAILLNLLDEQSSGRLLSYYTSGDVTGDYNNSVSYAATIFYEPEKREKEEKQKDVIRYLSDEEKKTLIKIAREVLTRYLSGESADDRFLDTFNITEKLKEERGVFVTLTKRSMLRGCIGYVRGVGPLYQAVRDNTINAASRDPRFEPVKPDEGKECDIEISVLTVPEAMSDVMDFEIGRHGLIIEKGWSRGLLLPQVPVEYGWDKITFLKQLSEKAGLPPDAYKSGAKMWRFEAQIFSEDEFK